MDNKVPKCDRCAAEATVHEVTVKGGVPKERHLCERCAQELGVHPKSATPPLKAILTEIIASSQVAQSPSGAPAETQASHCRQCGMPYSQFRASGLLGCPECYRTFEGLLAPLLARAHEGGTHHVGRKPARLGESEPASTVTAKAEVDTHAEVEAERRSRAAVLRRKLAEAVASEQYEVAAKLRDELLRSSTENVVRGKNARGGDVAQPSDGGER